MLGQCNATDQPKGELYGAIHRNAFHDLCEQLSVKFGGRLIFPEYSVQFPEAVEEDIVLILSELFASFNAQLGNAVAER